MTQAKTQPLWAHIWQWLLVLWLTMATVMAPAVQAETLKAQEINYQTFKLKKEDANTILKYAIQEKILPSIAISQLHLESFWGASQVGKVDNNWGGITWANGQSKSGVKETRGLARPANEGGYYVHFDSTADYLKEYFAVLTSNYKVAGQADFGKAVKGLFRVGGAPYDYAAVGYEEYKNRMNVIRAGINATNDNILDKWDKQATSNGKWDGTVADSGDVADETQNSINALAQAGPSDDSFTVNGYGSLTQKQFDEMISDAQAYVNQQQNPQGDLSSDQKTNLGAWIDDYNGKNTAKWVSISRMIIMLTGYLCLIYDLIITFAYGFDRVGIFEQSLVGVLSLGKWETAAFSEDSTFLQKTSTDESKRVGFKDIVIINIFFVSLFVLITTGALFRMVAALYVAVQQLAEWIVNLQVDWF